MKKSKKKINSKREKELPVGAIRVNLEALSHVNTYATIPEFYSDINFKCKRCGVSDVWKARHQKWYIEVSKNSLDSKPIFCKGCRVDREKEKQISRDQVKNRRNKGKGQSIN